MTRLPPVDPNGSTHGELVVSIEPSVTVACRETVDAKSAVFRYALVVRTQGVEITVRFTAAAWRTDLFGLSNPLEQFYSGYASPCYVCKGNSNILSRNMRIIG